MATTTEVKTALDDIAKIIINERKFFLASEARINSANNILLNLPATFADEISTIQAYPVDGSPFEQLSKDELEKLTDEFSALKIEVNNAVEALAAAQS